MKSLRFSILSGVAVAASLVVVFLVIDYTTRARIERMVHDTLNEISLPLLEKGNPSLLFAQLDEGVQLRSPSMTFITQYLPLIALDAWEGQIDVPAFFANGTPQAQLSARAHYSRGVADVRASLVYHDGEWLVREYEVMQGPAAQ